MSDEIERCEAEYPHQRHAHHYGRKRCPGIRIDPATRAQPAKTRTDMLAQLRRIKALVGWLVDDWSVTARVFDGSTDRARRLDEYPENDAGKWAELAYSAGRLAESLGSVERYARMRAREVAAFDRERAQRAAVAKLEG